MSVGDTIEQAVIETPHGNTESVDLPNGYLDGDGKIHKLAVMKEITGEEEDVLASRKTPVLKRMQMVLEKCTVKIGDLAPNAFGNAIKRLPTIDRLKMLIRLRSISLGKDYTFESICPNDQCAKKNRMTVDLDELEFKGLPDPKKRSFEVDLPKSKKKVVWAVMTGEDEEKIQNFQASRDMLSLAIMARVHEIDGKPPTLRDIKNLPMVDRDFLRGQFMDNEGSLDDEVEVTCPYCGEEYKTEIDVGQPSFFFPAGMSKH